MLSLPLLGGQAKIEPRHDAWPPTRRLPSGAICVDASFKEPVRQKVIDRATKATAFLTLTFIAIGHKQWPWSDLVNLIFDLIAVSRPIYIVEQLAVWILVGTVGVGAIVGSFRLLIAAFGLDRGQVSVCFGNDHLLVNGSIYDWQFVKSFEIEPHYLGKVEGHNEKRLSRTTNLYYRDSFILVLQYGVRRIEIAHILGRYSTFRMLARLQALSEKRHVKTSVGMQHLADWRL